MLRTPRADVVAGLTVGVVALPLALAFGIASGLGAQAGLVTAVVAGTVAALFGGSAVQVSGPTGAMTVVLVPIVAVHGTGGVLVVGFLAGVFLVALALLRAGRWVRLVPLPVVEGFTLGIAAIIALQQVPTALGIEVDGTHVAVLAADAVRGWIGSPGLAAPAMALGVALTMLVGAKLRPGIPFSLIAIVVATSLTTALALDVATIGALPSAFPMPSVPGVDLGAVPALVLPALAVAALAALESLLSATVADSMSVSERHDPDRELFGQGLANLVVPFFGGIPATAAIARTAVNVRTGARSRLAALVHAAFLLAVMGFAAPLVARVPLAALAGVLLATAIRMVEVSSVRALLRSTRHDAIVLGLTAVATIALDLVTAVVVGVVVAGALALAQVARSTRLEELELPEGDHSDEERALLAEHVVAYRLDGPLFFGAAHEALVGLAEVSDVRVVILRMSHVATLDATGAAVLRDTITELGRRNVAVLLSGVRDQHSDVLEALGVFDSLADRKHVFASTPAAIEHARTHAARIG